MARGGKREGAGRPKGSANKATADIREAAQQYSGAALATLHEVMTGGDSAAARVAAANAILDRAHGKPRQSVDVDGAFAGAFTVQYVTAPKGPAPTQSDEDYETGE